MINEFYQNKINEIIEYFFQHGGGWAASQGFKADITKLIKIYNKNDRHETDCDGWVKTSTIKADDLPHAGKPCEIKFSHDGDIIEAEILYFNGVGDKRQAVWVIIGQPDFYRVVTNG